MDSIESRLATLGIVLPPPPSPAGSYQPVTHSGNTLFVSGQISFRKGGQTAHSVPAKPEEFLQGKVGSDLSVVDGARAAEMAALNALAAIKHALNSLERIAQIVFLRGYVNCAPDFTHQSVVIDGASQVLVNILQERGRHSRVAVGVASLPLNAAIEIELTVQVK